MKAAVSVSVFDHTISIFIYQARFLHIFSVGNLEIVLINKVIASIVGRIDVDHLDFAEVALL